jgi:large conductance mechanosensitive channel
VADTAWFNGAPSCETRRALMAMNPPPAKRSLWQEFKEFLNQGDFVTIAVGLILALYVKSIIDNIIGGVINPIIAAIVGKPDLFQFGFDIGKARISIGAVINSIIMFLVVGFLLFLIIKAYNAFKAKSVGSSQAAETELSVLRDIRDQLRSGRGGAV